jgi:hypothetical protein
MKEIGMNRTMRLALGVVLTALCLTTVVIGASRLLAGTLATGSISDSIPDVMSYQGFLTASNSQPISGTVKLDFAIYDAATGGNLMWEESHPNTSVVEGYFTVLLGAHGSPLTASAFSGDTRYLQVKVDDGDPLPRQRIGSVPYALRASWAATAITATTAISVPWSNITSRPSGLDDGDDDTLGSLSCSSGQIAQFDGSSWVCASALSSEGVAHVITVAQSGGDYTSVAAALASISDNSSTNRYLVWVAPGVYTESELSLVKPYVHLRGSGPNATVILSTRSAAAIGPNAAAVQLENNARISDLTVRNEGVSSTFAMALYAVEPTSRAAVIDNVVAEANGAGGVAHFGIYLNDAEPTIRNSTFRASGATGGTPLNAALSAVNIAGGFPQPLIENSFFEGKGSNSGYGFALSSAAPTVRHSHIWGDFRGIAALVAGMTQVQHSQLQEGGFTDGALFETSGSGTVAVANSGVFYINKHTGTGNLVCIHAYKANYTAATNGTTAALACN